MKIEESKRKKMIEVANKAAIHLIECNSTSLTPSAIYERMDRIAEDLQFALMQAREK